MPRITKLQRWLDLIAYLVGRQFPVTVDELMRRIPAYAEKWVEGTDTSRATARRTFERDKDELRAAGIPIETVRYEIRDGSEEVEGYQLTGRDFYLPFLKISEGAGAPRLRGGGRRPAELLLPAATAAAALEAVERVAELPAFPLAAEARSAWGKLVFDLDPDRFERSTVLYAERPGAAELAGTVRFLCAALLARRRIRFRYHGIYRGTATDRDVAPYGLLFHGGNWYLVGRDATREAIRIFRADRMEVPEAPGGLEGPAEYEIPGDFHLRDYADRRAWELGGGAEEAPLQARVLFRFPSSLWADRNRFGVLEEARSDGSAVRRFEVSQVNPFLRWVLSQAGEARLMEPPELVAELEAMANAVARKHGAEEAIG